MPNVTDRNPALLDLGLKRSIDASAATIWKAWTDPVQLKQWWCPKPWTTSACDIDLRPGGAFSFTLRSPEGQEAPYAACYLEIVKERKLVYTHALEPGYRPAPDMPTVPMFSVVLTLAERAGKTDYEVRVLHRDEAGRKKHEEMGFHEGWGTCLNQLVALVTGAKS